MRLNEKQEVILTRVKAADIFCLLSNVRYKLNGKMRTQAEKYWKELEKVLGLEIKLDDNETATINNASLEGKDE